MKLTLNGKTGKLEIEVPEGENIILDQPKLAITNGPKLRYQMINGEWCVYAIESPQDVGQETQSDETNG